MYIAKHFNHEEAQQILNLTKSFPFVTLISKDSAGDLSISHVPVVTEFVNGELVSIKGHFACRNPHVGHLTSNPQVTIVFGGPHAYITPNWYKSGRECQPGITVLCMFMAGCSSVAHLKKFVQI